MKGGIGDIMKQAQQVQENLQKTQEDIANTEVCGESGAGLLKVVMTGRHDVKRVDIDPTLLDDKKMLEDLIAAAVNDANRKVEKISEDKMSNLTAGFELPAGLKLPFS
jgi:DNA-binding YbaB/EbfC family protein